MEALQKLAWYSNVNLWENIFEVTKDEDIL